jgi:Flp pilus assembly protein TadD
LDTESIQRLDRQDSVLLAALQTDNFARAIPLLREQYAASPEDPVAALELGWLLATCPDESLRRPAEAVRVSEELRARQPNPDPEVLDLAAAAYASAGRFDDAVSTARSAAELARRIGRLDLAGFIEQRLRRYEAHQPPVYTR